MILIYKWSIIPPFFFGPAQAVGRILIPQTGEQFPEQGSAVKVPSPNH